MSIRPYMLLLFGSLLLPASALAQQPPDGAVPAMTTEQDIGTLQAELAKVEAERQRLADELANAADHAQVEQLLEQNRMLRDRLEVTEQLADNQKQEQQHRWFIVGGATVAVSLLVGWLLAQMGGRRKRNEWLN